MDPAPSSQTRRRCGPFSELPSGFAVRGLLDALAHLSPFKRTDHPTWLSAQERLAPEYGRIRHETRASPRGPPSCPASNHANPARLVLLIVVTATVLRILGASLFGLGIDESYMVATGRELQLSYFDHPPLSWWLSWAASHLTGSEAPVVVRLPFIALFALSTVLMYRLTAMLFSREAGFWAALAFNVAPVFGFTSASWVLPDGPLFAALLGFMVCLAHATDAENHRSWGWWLGTGVCGGLALLSKYNAVLVLLGAAMAMLTHPAQRRWLLRPQPWVATAIAAALFSPVIWWNVEHHWSSVAFQGGRALGDRWHPLALLTVLGGEALYLLPWIWLPMMASLVAAWRRGPSDWPSWLLAWSGTLPIVLFALIGTWSYGRVLPHWAAPGYLVLFPLLGATLARWATTHGRALRRITAASVCLVVAAAAAVGSEIRWNWLPSAGMDFTQGTDPDLDAVDWTSLVPEMQARGWIGSGKPVVATLSWRDAGKLDYAIGGAATVICLCDDPRQFGLIHPAAAHQGEDILILAPGASPAHVEKRIGRLFERLEPQPALTVLHAGRPAMEIPVFIGRHMNAP
jgi:hypothetical protein